MLSKRLIYSFFIAISIAETVFCQNYYDDDDDESWTGSNSCTLYASSVNYCTFWVIPTTTTSSLTYKASTNIGLFDSFLIDLDQYNCWQAMNPGCTYTDDVDDNVNAPSTCLDFFYNPPSMSNAGFTACSGLTSPFYSTSDSCTSGVTSCEEHVYNLADSWYYVVIAPHGGNAPVSTFTVNFYYYLDDSLVGFVLFSAIFFPLCVCACCIAGCVALICRKKRKRTPTPGTVIQLKGSPVNNQTVHQVPPPPPSQTVIGTQGQYGQPVMIQGQYQYGGQSVQMFNGQEQYGQQPPYVVGQGHYGQQQPMSMDQQASYGNQQHMHMNAQSQNGQQQQQQQQPVYVVDGNGQYIQTVQQ